MWFIFKLSAFRSKERREICACNRCRVIVVKIISLCYIISLFLYLLRVRFGSRVWLKPREKQVPAAPKSLKANVDKPQLKHKAVWRENVARESTFNGKHDVLIFCKLCFTKITWVRLTFTSKVLIIIFYFLVFGFRFLAWLSNKL